MGVGRFFFFLFVCLFVCLFVFVFCLFVFWGFLFVFVSCVFFTLFTPSSLLSWMFEHGYLDTHAVWGV